MAVDKFTPNQLVRAVGRKAKVLRVESEGWHIYLQFLDTGEQPSTPYCACALQPMSIRKSYAGEGKNYVD